MNKIIFFCICFFYHEIILAQPTVITTDVLGVGTTNAVYKATISQDVTMDDDVVAGQVGITGGTDNRKRLVLGYDTNGDGFGYIKAGYYTQKWTNLALQPTGGFVGIGTAAPQAKLHVFGGGNVMQIGQPGSGTDNYIKFVGSVNSFDVGATASGFWGIADAGVAYRFVVTQPGNVGIGTNTPQAKLDVNGTVSIGSGNTLINDPTYNDYKLFVNGNIAAKKLKVLQSGWADYVFNPGYILPTLPQVDSFIQKHKHLPAIPSSKEVTKDGIDVGEMQKLMMQKIEELTLYAIEQNKKIDILNKKIEILEIQKNK